MVILFATYCTRTFFLILQSLQYLQRITAFKILLQTSAKPESSSIYLTLQAMCYIATTATGNTHVICIKKNVHKWQKMRKKKRQPLNLAKSPSQAMELTGKNLRPIMETQTLGPISNSLSKNQNHLFLPNFLSFGKDIYIYPPLSTANAVHGRLTVYWAQSKKYFG